MMACCVTCLLIVILRGVDMYSAYAVGHIYTHGNMLHVLANAKTEKGMLGELKCYMSRMDSHHHYSDNTKVHLWCIDKSVYSIKALEDFKA
jgi:hypothetical protein